MKPSPGSEERELAGRLRNGDRAALEETYRRHAAPVFRLALRLLRDRQQAEDVTQDCFIRAWEAAPGFRGGSSLRTWLCRIALNLCYRNLRRRRSTPLESAESVAAPEPGPAEAAARGSLGEALDRALGTLPADWQAALVMRETLEMTYEEMSDAMHCPVGTVRSRLFRARAALRERLAAAGLGKERGR